MSQIDDFLSGKTPESSPQSIDDFLGGKPKKKKESGGSFSDYASSFNSALGQGVANSIGAAGTFIQAPAANTLSGIFGAKAAVDRGLTWLINQAEPGSAVPHEQTQEDAQLASQFSAESRAENANTPWNLPARAGRYLEQDSRRVVAENQANDRATNPELMRQQQAMGDAEGFVGNLKAAAQNPLALTHTLVKSAPDMALGVGVGSVLARARMAGAAAAGEAAAANAAKAGANEATQAAAAKAAIDAVESKAVASASTAGTLSEAGSSAMQAREGTYQEVAAMPLETLAKSPRFQQIMAQNGGDAVKARETLANELADQATMLSGAGTMAGSALTNKLFGGDATAKSIVGGRMSAKELGKRIGQDTVEEGLQGVPEDAAQHGATVQADPSKKYDPAGSLAQNMVAGFAMGSGGHGLAYTKEAIASMGKGGQTAPAPGAPAAPAQNTAPTAANAAPVETEAEKALRTPTSMTALDRAHEITPELTAARERLADLTPENGYGPAFDQERQELASRADSLQAELDGITKTWPKTEYGAKTNFSTEAGARIEGAYALMDANDLVTSHDENLRANPLYPQEMQPRDRSRSASEMQVSGIVQKLDPARLGLSADAATGAPIVGEDGLVESGNARTIAMKRVYQANGQKASDYKQFLRDNAAQFGITPESVDAMAKPVLVRVRTTPVNRAEFARQANASTVAAMSPSEQAKSDASRIDAMDDLAPDDAGDFSGPASRPFIRRFMARLPGTEQSGMIDADGNLSTTGYTRVRNAILAKAYGDSPVLMRMVESLDDNLRNITKALISAAPKVAQMRDAIAKGARFDSDITPDLMAAVEELSRLKDAGTSVSDALAQAGMFGDKYSPETRELLQFLADNIRRPRRMADFIVAYMDALDRAGDPAQGSMFGDNQAPTRQDLIKAAKSTVGENTDATAQDTQRGIAGEDAKPGEKTGGKPEDAPGSRRGDQGDGVAGPAAEQERGTQEQGRAEAVTQKAETAEPKPLQEVGASEKTPEKKPVTRTADRDFWAYAKEQGHAPGDVKVGSELHTRLKAEFDALKAGKARMKEITGDKINEDWTAFSAKSDTMGVPRAEMPQIKAEHRGALTQFLAARGVAHEADADVSAMELKPTQAEFSPGKVKQAQDFEGGDRSILVSADGFVLDGHHQWLAKLSQGLPVRVIRFDAPTADLLPLAREFPSAEVARGAEGVEGKQQDGLKSPTPDEIRQRVTQQEQAEKERQRKDQEAGDAGSTDFIPAPDGGLDFGEITPEMSKAMRRQAGKIRLTQGVQNSDGTGHGLVHIEANHGKEIRAAGFDSAQAFLADAFRSIDEVWKPGKTTQLIAVQSGRAGKVAFIQLEADSKGGEDFYRVNSAFPASEKYVARKEKKEGWKPLWSRYPVPADASGASGFVGQSPEAGETTPTVSGQSGKPSLPQAEKIAKPPSKTPAKIEDSGEVLEGARKPENDNGTVMLSRSQATQQAYEARIDALFAGGGANRVGVRVLDRSDVLSLLGFEGLPLVLRESKVIKGLSKHPAMTADLWKKVPEWIENPAAVFDSHTVQGALVFVAPELVNGAVVLVTVEPDSTVSASLVAHEVTNAYDKDAGPPPFGLWLRDGLARYVNQKEFPTVAARAGLQLPREATANKPGTRKILTEKNLSGHRKEHGIAMSRAEFSGQGMTKEALDALVNRIKAKMPNMPTVHVLADPSEAPPALREYIIRQDAWDDVEGAMHKGELYMFASGLFDELRAEHVLAEHEAAHFGLRAVLGSSLKTAMHLVYAQNASVRRAVTELQKRGKLSNAEATEEVIVDIPTAELAKLKGWRKVVMMVRDWMQAHGYDKIAQKITDMLDGSLSQQQRADLFVAELVRGARDYVAGKSPSRRVGYIGDTRLSTTLQEDIKRQEDWLQREARARGFADIEDMLAKNYPLFEKLAELWRKKNPAEGGGMLSRRPDTKAAYEARIDALFSGGLANLKGVHLLDKSDVLDLLGLGNMPVQLDEAKVILNQTNHPEMTADVWKKIPEWLDRPALVTKSRSVDGRYEITPSETVLGAPFLIIIEPKGGKVMVHALVNAYAKDKNPQGEIEAIARKISSGNVAYVDTKKASELLGRSGLQLPRLPSLNTDRKKILTEKNLNGYVKARQQGNDQSGQDEPIRLSRAPAKAQGLSVQERADEIIHEKAKAGGSVLDAAAHALTRLTRLEKITSRAYDFAAQQLDRFTPDAIKAGVVSDYGVPESVIDQRAVMQGRKMQHLRKVGGLLDKLNTLTRSESRVAYAWMNEADASAADGLMQDLPAESVKVLQEVQKMIDHLSREAVSLGQLSEQAYKAHRFAYLRRSYAKHVVELSPKENAKRGRTISVLGDQYKGRGFEEGASMRQIQAAAPDWWKRKTQEGKADTALKGEKFIRLERRAPSGEGVTPLDGMDGKQPGRVLEVNYWPAAEPMPVKYQDWTQAGTFEARDTQGDKVVMWRDYTKDEREKMGEVDEARFAIAKTLHGMIHDVEVGRYLRWIAQTQAKLVAADVPGKLVTAEEGWGHVFKPGEWVQVPDTKITGTDVAKYGKLAGRFVPGPVWNDVRQLGNSSFGKVPWEAFNTLQSWWKTSKTALSPGVHMNNIMSNFVMADWHDVSPAHVRKALRILMAASNQDNKGMLGKAMNAASKMGIADREAAQLIVNRYKDSGGELGSWATVEMQNDQLEPILKDLQKELGIEDELGNQVGAFNAVQQFMHAKFPAVYNAAGGLMGSTLGRKGAKVAGKVVGGVVQEGKTLIDLYQSEDEVFRLAAWLKSKEAGMDDMAAGKVSRKSFLDYSVNAPWIVAMKNSAWPFMAFSYRAIPMFLETAGKKPHKLLKLMAVAGALNAMGAMLAGGDDDDDEDKLRKLLPEEKAGRIWGMVPKLIRMPWNDAHGSPVFLDVRRFVPVGDVFDVDQGHSAIPLPPALQIGGIIGMLSEVMLNTSAFTGKPITLETDTWRERSAKVLDYMYKWMMPNVLGVPGSYATTGVQNAYRGKEDPFGREQSIAQAISSAFGLKLGSYPTDVLRQNLVKKTKAESSEIDHNITKLSRQYQQNGISREEFDEGVQYQLAKKTKLWEEMGEKMR